MSSVSRVLSGHPDVSLVMRNRVMDAVAALGYEANILAQSLRRGATMTVGFVVGDVSNPLLAQIALGAEVHLRAAGYSMLLTNSFSDSDVDRAHIRLFRQRRVDGLLLSLADQAAEQTIAELEHSDAPFVMVDRDTSGLSNACAVLSAHAQGITDAAEHLIALGHRRLALINGNPKVRPAQQRAAALRRVCRKHAVAVSVRSGSFSAEHGEMATTSILQSPDPPTALIAGGNQILTGVLRAVRRAGLAIPDDLSLVTCDDIPLLEFIAPPIATIVRDPRELGRISAKLLLEQLSSANPRQITLSTRFRPEASCARPRARSS